jgi:hypothetical protein
MNTKIGRKQLMNSAFFRTNVQIQIRIKYVGVASFSGCHF